MRYLILTETSRPPLVEMTEKHLDINHVLWRVSEEEKEHEEQREENTRETGTQSLPSRSPVSFLQHKKTPIPNSLPQMPPAPVLFTLTHSKGKYKTVILSSNTASRAVQPPSVQVWLKHLWEKGLQRIQSDISNAKTFLFSSITQKWERSIIFKRTNATPDMPFKSFLRFCDL